MKIFSIADLHLSFGQNIQKPMDIFGPAWENYEERLMDAWKSAVSEEDLVIIPGDISWAMHLEDAAEDLKWISALPGKKILIRGNHDLWWSSLKKMRAMAPDIIFLQNDCYLGEGFAVAGTRGWLCPGCRDFSAETDGAIYRRELLRLEMSMEKARPVFLKARSEGRPFKLIAATHFPPMNEKKQPSGFTEAFDINGVDIAVYGHLHGNPGFFSGPMGKYGETEYVLCSLDWLECRPVLIAEV